MEHILVVARDDDGRRLDRVLRKCLPELPLSALHRLFRRGRIRVDGKSASASDRVREGSKIMLPELFSARADSPSPQLSTAPTASIQVLFENDDLLIANKEEGQLTHGPDSLEIAVRAYLAPTQDASLSFRSGPLHRLDRGTSGLLAFSVSLRGAQLFTKALSSHRIVKRYLAVLEGNLKGRESWEDELVRDRVSGVSHTLMAAPEGSGQRALTIATPLLHSDELTLACLELHTGRTHQIRVQSASHGHPLRGDRKYGGSGAEPFLLHALELRFLDDLGLGLPERLVAPLPPRFNDACRRRFGAESAEVIETLLRQDRK